MGRANLFIDKQKGEKHPYWYHPDHLGSTSLVTGHQGLAYEHIEYLPYGESWIEKSYSNGNDLQGHGDIPYKFTSKEWDKETGLYSFPARYYEPKLSRWMSADPAGFELANPMERDGRSRLKVKLGYNIIEAMNWYGYTNNNPVKYTDPTGMESENLNIYYPDPAADNPSQVGEEVPPPEFEWPTDGKMTSGFGMRKVKPERHKGVDVANKEGTEIRAAGDGEVLRVRNDEDGYGNYLIIGHKDGKETRYAHLKDTPSVKVGDKVRKGDPIGSMGKTGNSTGSHLHFEVRVDGKAVDPRKYLQAGPKK